MDDNGRSPVIAPRDGVLGGDCVRSAALRWCWLAVGAEAAIDGIGAGCAVGMTGATEGELVGGSIGAVGVNEAQLPAVTQALPEALPPPEL